MESKTKIYSDGSQMSVAHHAAFVWQVRICVAVRSRTITGLVPSTVYGLITVTSFGPDTTMSMMGTEIMS